MSDYYHHKMYVRKFYVLVREICCHPLSVEVCTCVCVTLSATNYHISYYLLASVVAQTRQLLQDHSVESVLINITKLPPCSQVTRPGVLHNTRHTTCTNSTNVIFILMPRRHSVLRDHPGPGPSPAPSGCRSKKVQTESTGEWSWR